MMRRRQPKQRNKALSNSGKKVKVKKEEMGLLKSKYTQVMMFLKELLFDIGERLGKIC